ncbi:MAG: hypothetical protein ACLS29_07595 [Prevotellamassilia sp.]
MGRSVVAQCGSLIARVLYVKEGITKRFLIVDAGFTELIRPALYDAHHFTQNLSAATDSPQQKYDVVGPICESSDVFSTDELLPSPAVATSLPSAPPVPTVKSWLRPTTAAHCPRQCLAKGLQGITRRNEVQATTMYDDVAVV